MKYSAPEIAFFVLEFLVSFWMTVFILIACFTVFTYIENSLEIIGVYIIL